MKILLVAINAKYIHSNLAVHSLKTVTGEYSENVEIAEYTINNLEDNILESIYERKPDVIAFSCYIWNIALIKELILDLALLLPNVPIWVGGPEVSYSAKEFLGKNTGVTGVMIGEGEIIFKNLVKYYVNQKTNPDINEYAETKLENIKGICFRCDDEIITTPPEEVMDLSNIPFVYDKLENFDNRIIYYESSRGCPFSCSYCLSSVDKKTRFRSLDLVDKELQFFIDNKVAQVKFVDRTFNCKKQHALHIWNYIKEHDNGITNFHFEIAADLLDEEQLETLNTMRPGLVQVEIGVQSTNEKTLEAIRRKQSYEHLKKITSRINAGKNVHQHLDLIAGLPYEDYKSFGNSFNMVYALEPEQLQLGFLKLLRGSQMYYDANKYGIVCKENPTYEVLYTKWLSHDDVIRLKEVCEMVEIYYNSRQFTTTLSKLDKLFSSPFEMFEKIADYYKSHFPENVKHSRINRYNILRDFIKETIIKLQPNQEKTTRLMRLFDNLLSFDIYLRENIKTKPDFSKNPGEYTAAIREYLYREGRQTKLVHIEKFDYSYEMLINETNPMILADEESTSFLLFEYETRNPLDHSAFVLDVTKDILMLK